MDEVTYNEYGMTEVEMIVGAMLVFGFSFLGIVMVICYSGVL
jgi:hypothetical protein